MSIGNILWSVMKSEIVEFEFYYSYRALVYRTSKAEKATGRRSIYVHCRRIHSLQTPCDVFLSVSKKKDASKVSI